ncbi:hypothetical protein SeMB42_g01909 [Synchytrium endobioticum]|uniref:Uncharacterized protein n=1 Tax=Synchytrium endobioticum TaxID=286115 RepID=A0A507DKY6_9FUNG|nr:hypothetical protein SeMB42_g01909 [Synchytrium endobioticum]
MDAVVVAESLSAFWIQKPQFLINFEKLEFKGTGIMDIDLTDAEVLEARNLATELLVLLNQINDGVGEWASKKEQWGHDTVRQAVLPYVSMSVLQEISGTQAQTRLESFLGSTAYGRSSQQTRLKSENGQL